MPANTAIEFNHVYKTYNNDKHALKNITFKILENEFVYITGHSGAGKSTLFRLLCAQEAQTSGLIKVQQKDLSEYNLNNIHLYRKKIGILFQDFKLLNSETCFENIQLPLKIIGHMSSRQIQAKIESTCDLMQIDRALLFEYPESLSGGEQQKIALARAIIHEPQLIYADEPTGNLDKESSLNVINILKELTQRKTTVLIATHDEVVMKNYPSRIIHLKNGETVLDQTV